MRSSEKRKGLACSFCHKAQGVVGKLISSASDYPRAYICDECIFVCNSIIEDDRVDGTRQQKFPVRLSLESMDGVIYMSVAEIERLRDSLDKILARPSPESPAQAPKESGGTMEQ